MVVVMSTWYTLNGGDSKATMITHNLSLNRLT